MAVKSKSMATEEIHLNDALEHAGVTPIETDLGEYIIQLAHERPSHIIAPAIHKTKGQVADLFSRELGGQFAADPEVLTAVARRELRQKFLQADMGITGANFAVADTGTLVLVTNEGNGRMVTSLPRIHVAVMGMEKVIPSMTDLMVFLAILARSATGQKLSSYTTLVRGPRRPASWRVRRSYTSSSWTTAGCGRSRGPCARRSTACAAARASTSARCTGRSVATPTGTRTRVPSASSSPRCWKGTAR
jgi:L-lactate utilization protein LutB